MDVCAGLAYIHTNGMVHGDLKAANVMVSFDGTAMIADFGNAQLKDLTLKFTHTTNGALSIRWAAPELLLGDDGPQASKEADVYAFGMTVLEVVTGKVPFEDVSDKRLLVLIAIDKKGPPRPDTGMSEDLWRILNACWIREPAERPVIASVQDRLQALLPPPHQVGLSHIDPSPPHSSTLGVKDGLDLNNIQVSYGAHERRLGTPARHYSPYGKKPMKTKPGRPEGMSSN